MDIHGQCYLNSDSLEKNTLRWPLILREFHCFGQTRPVNSNCKTNCMAKCDMVSLVIFITCYFSHAHHGSFPSFVSLSFQCT